MYLLLLFSKKASFKESIQKVLEIWRKEPTSDKVVEDLYMLTAKEFEYCLNEKLTSCLADLPDEDAAELCKFFYMTYQRITQEKKNCLSLKSGKIFPIHQDLVEKKGIGMLHRALFSTEKKAKKKGEKEED